MLENPTFVLEIQDCQAAAHTQITLFCEFKLLICYEIEIILLKNREASKEVNETVLDSHILA